MNNSFDNTATSLLKHLQEYKRLHQKEVSILDREINSIRRYLVKNYVKSKEEENNKQ